MAEARPTGQPLFKGTPGDRHIVVELRDPFFGWCDDEILPKRTEVFNAKYVTWHIYNGCGRDVTVSIVDFKDKDDNNKPSDPPFENQNPEVTVENYPKVDVKDGEYQYLMAKVKKLKAAAPTEHYKYTLLVKSGTDKHDNDPELIIY